MDEYHLVELFLLPTRQLRLSRREQGDRVGRVEIVSLKGIQNMDVSFFGMEIIMKFRNIVNISLIAGFILSSFFFEPAIGKESAASNVNEK